jgi:hypothetical protein
MIRTEIPSTALSPHPGVTSSIIPLHNLIRSPSPSPSMSVPVGVYRRQHTPSCELLCALTLNKGGQHLAARLQQRVSDDNLQEALKAFAAVFNHVVGEAVRQDLARQWGNGDARRLALEDVAEGFELVVPAAHRRRLELEGGDVGAHYDLVGRVHAAPDACESQRLLLRHGQLYSTHHVSLGCGPAHATR